jgi:hypothetical protein
VRLKSESKHYESGMGTCETEGGNESNESESRATYTTGGRCSWSTYLPATASRQARPDCAGHLATDPRQACPDCASVPATDDRHQETIVRIINKLIVIRTRSSINETNPDGTKSARNRSIARPTNCSDYPESSRPPPKSLNSSPPNTTPPPRPAKQFPLSVKKGTTTD